MGVLLVKGNSTKEFICDVMYIKFVFNEIKYFKVGRLFAFLKLYFPVLE